jgi:hypothetical protein
MSVGSTFSEAKVETPAISGEKKSGSVSTTGDKEAARESQGMGRCFMLRRCFPFSWEIHGKSIEKWEKHGKTMENHDEQLYLVGALEHEWILTFHSVGNRKIPTDELIFFRGVGIPPTSSD